MRPHTPGPWHVVTDDGSVGSVRAENGVDVAQALQTHPRREDLYMEERKANTILIAAAPELLEALCLCANVLAGHDMSKSALTRALEKSAVAIAKAKGQGGE